MNFNPLVRDAIIDHAKSEFPRESVGCIHLGEYHKLVNNSLTLETDFSVPDQIAAAMYSAGFDALVHSHTNGQACPSQTDMQSQFEMAKPWLVTVLSPSTEQGVSGPAYRESFWFGDQLPMAPLVGRQFRHGVHDCYSLVRDWYRQERGVWLPPFPREEGWWAKGQNLIDDALASVPFREVPLNQGQVGDVIKMTIGGTTTNHLGVYHGNGLVLHHLSGRFSTFSPLLPWMGHFNGKVFHYVG